MKKGILTLDCGATNVKASVIDEKGQILSSYSISNNTVADPFHAGGLIWDMPDIIGKLIQCIRKVTTPISETDISALTVTSFGVDGTAVKKDGTLCYPVISWQCKRTEDAEKKLGNYFDREWLYKTTGLQSYHFNTINKLTWLKENRPDVLDTMDYFAFVPSIIVNYFTGELATDITMAGTSMLTEIRSRSISTDILSTLGLGQEIFPRVVEPGQIMGLVSPHVAEECGINPGVPVFSAGHDTQFALLGAFAGFNQPVLSSGTWEILMVRSDVSKLILPFAKYGITTEFDVVPGLVDSGIQWVASGMIEWISSLLYGTVADKEEHYRMLIAEASKIDPGCNGIEVIPEIYPGGMSSKKGSISGFSHTSNRTGIYRATLEALSYYAYRGLKKLEQSCNFTSDRVICTGGGSKNALWNQIRSDVFGIPVMVPEVTEATGLGAAMTAMVSLGIYKTFDEAYSVMSSASRIYEPGRNAAKYKDLCRNYISFVFNE